MFAKSIGLSVLLVAGCASLSSAGKGVQLTDNPNEVRTCRELGEVSAPPPYGLPDDWKIKLRNGAAELGGNRVFSNGPPLVGAASGRAYACP
jgi:hypothetical protein